MTGVPPAAAPRRRLPLQLQPRFQVVLACFLATLTAYVERVGFSIAFTAMAAEVRDVRAARCTCRWCTRLGASLRCS